MNRTHYVKCWPGPYEALSDGRKTFEWRKDDRGYTVGDELVVQWWDPTPSEHTRRPAGYGSNDRSMRFTITYITQGGQFGMPPGYVCMGLRREPCRK